MAEYFVYNGGLYSTDELYHYGVKGMKWGVRKSVYKSMNRQQRKAQRQKYKQSPEGRIKKAANIGALLGGPLGATIAVSIQSKKLSDIERKTLDKGKQEINKCKNTKITTDKHKIQKTLDYEKSNSNGKKETDEQRIKRLMKEGKTNPNANYVFDQNGNLFMVTWD